MTDTTTAPGIDDLQTLARRALEAAEEREGMIAVAESCTGGEIASLLTGVEGLSHAFDRGFITYSEKAKSDMLGIDSAVIERVSAVSEEVGRLMAKHTLARSDALASVAVTGYIGGCADADENGLVHIVAMSRGGGAFHRECHFGDVSRDQGTALTSQAALELLIEAIEATG